VNFDSNPNLTTQSESGEVLYSSKLIVEHTSKEHSAILRDIRKMFPLDYKEIRENWVGCGRTYTKEIFLTKKQVVQLLRSFRNLSQKGKELLESLGDVCISSSSAEGLFGDMLEYALIGFNVGKNAAFNLCKQVKTDRGYVFDFYIPEADLYIEYNEQGNHHSYTYDKKKKESVNQEVMCVCYKTSHIDNVKKVLKK
jgi:hypothetical protein